MLNGLKKDTLTSSTCKCKTLIRRLYFSVGLLQLLLDIIVGKTATSVQAFLKSFFLKAGYIFHKKTEHIGSSQIAFLLWCIVKTFFKHLIFLSESLICRLFGIFSAVKSNCLKATFLSEKLIYLVYKVSLKFEFYREKHFQMASLYQRFPKQIPL